MAHPTAGRLKFREPNNNLVEKAMHGGRPGKDDHQRLRNETIPRRPAPTLTPVIIAGEDVRLHHRLDVLEQVFLTRE